MGWIYFDREQDLTYSFNPFFQTEDMDLSSCSRLVLAKKNYRLKHRGRVCFGIKNENRVEI